MGVIPCDWAERSCTEGYSGILRNSLDLVVVGLTKVYDLPRVVSSSSEQLEQAIRPIRVLFYILLFDSIPPTTDIRTSRIVRDRQSPRDDTSRLAPRRCGIRMRVESRKPLGFHGERRIIDPVG